MNGIVFKEMAKRAVFGPAQARAAAKIFRDNRVVKTDRGHFAIPEMGFAGPRRGDALKDLRSRYDEIGGGDYVFGDKNWTPEDRTVFDGIIKGVHEVGEARALKAPPGRSMDKFDHESALPILLEHNAAVSARKSGYSRPADAVGAMRSGQEEDVIRSILPDYRHGISRRLSRGEVKNINRILENRAVPWWRRFFLREQWPG